MAAGLKKTLQLEDLCLTKLSFCSQDPVKTCDSPKIQPWEALRNCDRCPFCHLFLDTIQSERRNASLCANSHWPLVFQVNPCFHPKKIKKLQKSRNLPASSEVSTKKSQAKPQSVWWRSIVNSSVLLHTLAPSSWPQGHQSHHPQFLQTTSLGGEPRYTPKAKKKKTRNVSSHKNNTHTDDVHDDWHDLDFELSGLGGRKWQFC